MMDIGVASCHLSDRGGAGWLSASPTPGSRATTPARYDPAVTIEAVSILSPNDQASQAQGIRPWPFTPAGPVPWTYSDTDPRLKPPLSGTSVVGLALPPHKAILVGIPLRMSGTCYDPTGWATQDVFFVKERYLFFTHWVTITFQSPLLLHEPSYPGGEPARDLVCLGK